MAPLKSLERDYPILDANFQSFCACHAIFSVEDFLLHDIYELAAFAEQLPTSERLKHGITQMLSIIDSQHQPWMDGMELLEDAQRNNHFLSTGFEGIDALLCGGFREGRLTELVGPSSSGKTQVCLKSAANVAMKNASIVFYLDTGNSFSPQRISEFVHQISDSVVDQVKQGMLEQVMSRIMCHSVFDIFAMFNVLHQLEFNLRSRSYPDRHVRLLIIDSISALVTPILGGGSSLGHALMISTGYLLKKLAHENNVAVLVTNHTVGGERGKSKPALGESWKGIPHVRLQLSHDPGSTMYKASIIKHSMMEKGICLKANLFARFPVEDATIQAISVIGQIRDYPDRKEKPQSVLHVITEQNSVRVRADVGYCDFSLDGISQSEEEDLDSFYKRARPIKNQWR